MNTVKLWIIAFLQWLLAFFVEPAPPQVVEERALTVPKEEEAPKKFQHRNEWFCGCGARLAIRSTMQRGEGPSNYENGIQPSRLNWMGLVEERGWKTDPITCPACQVGATVEEYKAAKRLALSMDEYRAARLTLGE